MTRDDLDASLRVINEMISNGADGIADACIDVMAGKYSKSDQSQFDNESRYLNSLVDVSHLIRDAYAIFDDGD